MAGRAVVLGGGLGGLAAAWELARNGEEVTLLERSSTLGGLAGSFEHEGAVYPLGYHHIVRTDRTLLRFLDLIGALPEVRWRRIKMLMRVQGELYDLGSPSDVLRLPMTSGQRLRFAQFMARSYLKRDWSDWHGRSAAELLHAWRADGVRETIFDPLCRAKFELRTADVSAAWLGARLHAREGATALGYIPGTNWTKTLCEGVARLAHEAGVELRTDASVSRVVTNDDRVVEVQLDTGESVGGDLFVSAMPTDTLTRLLPVDAEVERIRYTALLSLICGTRQDVPDDFYWLSLLSPKLTNSGIFMLTALNPTIGHAGEHCINFVTHLHGRDREVFAYSNEEFLTRSLDDYRTVFGIDLEPTWSHLTRVPAYSPVFDPGYRNPEVRSHVWSNLYFAGNYRTYPSLVSTGTALQSGVECGKAALQTARTRPRKRRVARSATVGGH